MKLLKLVFATALYLLLLGLVWLAIVNFFKVDVVFYSALGAAAVALAVQALLVLATPVLRELNPFEKFQHLASCVLVGYILAISVPTVIDRSLSFYILEKLQQRGGGIQLGKFNYIFTTEYMREHRLVDIRLTEQTESGTIVIDGDCVKLTPKGEKIASFGRFFRQSLLPKQRLLMGEYTDQLTNPFRRSDTSPDYLCH
ncbi:hypothetical protein KBW71_08280 [Hydrogenophaga aromaticivorans]|uniref:hypothetical protein n=1 Tax=Hydrogenophaga aromaticivorans TaxID=2610898 RepID=UPI001B396D06|nr:hypothetical protein [Hydrogenophaga aromaticivorans]MBQ0918440.1 hypothetical protein [Hydrogenophaga aromaticivorans]